MKVKCLRAASFVWSIGTLVMSITLLVTTETDPGHPATVTTSPTTVTTSPASFRVDLMHVGGADQAETLGETHNRTEDKTLGKTVDVTIDVMSLICRGSLIGASLVSVLPPAIHYFEMVDILFRYIHFH